MASCSDASVGLSFGHQTFGAVANRTPPPTQLQSHTGRPIGRVVVLQSTCRHLCCLYQAPLEACPCLDSLIAAGVCALQSSPAAGQVPARQVGLSQSLYMQKGVPTYAVFAEIRHVQVSPRYRLSERSQLPIPYFRQKAAAQLPAGDAAGMSPARVLTPSTICPVTAYSLSTCY